MSVPLSILDLAPISEGCDAATALRNTVDLAQHAEQWGYKRYWIAEHHFVAVASSSPAVLIGQIAAVDILASSPNSLTGVIKSGFEWHEPVQAAV